MALCNTFFFLIMPVTPSKDEGPGLKESPAQQATTDPEEKVSPVDVVAAAEPAKDTPNEQAVNTDEPEAERDANVK